jgi:hypothetical protein
MRTARVCSIVVGLAAGAGLACCLLLALVWTAKVALSESDPVASHWEEEPVPARSLRWLPLYDNEILFCLDDRAGVGVDEAWVQDNLSRHWGIDARPSCVSGVTPDVRIIIEDFGSPQPAGWARVDVSSSHWSWLNLDFYQHCEINLNAAVFWQRLSYVWPGTSTFLPDVPEKTLLHEFGHCAGLSHREDPGYRGAMYPMMLYYPNEEDIASLPRDSEPWLLFGLVRRILQVMGMSA